MAETKPTRTVRRGRIFPEIQWSEEKKAQRQAEREAFYEKCAIFQFMLEMEFQKF